MYEGSESEETESGTQDQDEDKSHQKPGQAAMQAGLGILFAWLPKFHRRSLPFCPVTSFLVHT
jgi:hypothetical protein